MSTWIDFRALRQSVRFADVLAHYGVQLKTKGDQASGFCPLPNHDGQKRSPSFSVNLRKNVFRCFGACCGAQGNVIDFCALMEGLNPGDKDEFRRAALLLHERFGSGGGTREGCRSPANGKRRGHSEASDSGDTAPTASPEVRGGDDPRVVVNAPLDFELKNLDPKHPYLSGRGFTIETAAHFGLGYCSRGLLKGRIAIPIHDQSAKLIGYAGRLVDDALVSEENPKYRFPSKREHDGVLHEFRKSLLVYNGFAVQRGCRNLIVVEGFPSVWWLWQHGYPNVVALMGWSCSAEQAKLIMDLVHPGGCVWLLSDGDEGGRRCAESVLMQVASERFVRWIRLTENRQPTDCEVHELDALLSSAGEVESCSS